MLHSAWKQKIARIDVPLSELLSWKSHHVVKFQRIVGEPIDLVIGDHLIARGEVVIVEDHFAIRIVEICHADEKIFCLVKLQMKSSRFPIFFSIKYIFPASLVKKI